VAEATTGARLTNSIGMELVLLMPAEFTLGSPADEGERGDDEHALPVLLGRPFLMGTTEVTQAEYARVMGANPSWYRPGGEGAGQVEGLDAARLPVEQVSWEDAVEFCRRLTAVPGEKARGMQYRLPTEAEWEFACRAGTVTAFSTGPLLGPAEANVDGTKAYLDAEEAPGLRRPAPVGSYRPNAWGLLDMHGNVAEWCSDFHSVRSTTGGTTQVDPRGPETGDARTTRGGAFLGRVGQCRSAARAARNPEFRHRTIGFRVVAVTAETRLR
jgi:formylglycine-generating enzyme required for sulfatase activity